MAKKYKVAEKERRPEEHNEALSRLGGDKHSADSSHGPFRVKQKVNGLAFELELPDKSGYCFYPVMHVSRLKPMNEFPSRLKTRLTHEVTEDWRFDFDEELLPGSLIT
ncbi:hypothetical protein F441_12262 [Phytophthora nicotianae CJ01A1]|uniref:Tf2-1-like SH3-like domain-containing protein n=1 Tax=Phytophthora nicotianae CJ01A1 TaxID=1317063 RepID=W2WP69_PHYNI|nr:hypothetical protein F441_12262 [Phytophthora nicotianae CJ01A1]